MDDHSAYRSAGLAALYDAVYAEWSDVAFWARMTAAQCGGPLLELGCGTGRVLLLLARAGRAVTGIDLAAHMLERCRVKLQAEPPEIRDRVTLLEADMTSFDVDDRFAQIYCSCGTFHHLITRQRQLACLERCERHLLPGGRLVLDLFNAVPASGNAGGDEPADTGVDAEDFALPDGRRVRYFATVVDGDAALPWNECEVAYEILGPDGTTSRLTEAFPMRFVSRAELEDLLDDTGFQIEALYGDHDLSAYAENSPGMIVVAALRSQRPEPRDAIRHPAAEETRERGTGKEPA